MGLMIGIVIAVNSYLFTGQTIVRGDYCTLKVLKWNQCKGLFHQPLYWFLFYFRGVALIERFEFLFVDIEWNQKAGTTDIQNREPIQIGVIGTNESMDCEKFFSKGICLDDIEALTEATCKLTHTCKMNVMQGKTEKEIFHKLNQSFESYKYIIVWARDTYELFIRGMKRAGLTMPKHSVIVLQEILSIIAVGKGKIIGFETALRKARIAYQPHYLHYAKHDVKYLVELYKWAYLKYIMLTKDESNVINAKSKIIHREDCRYVKSQSIAAERSKKGLLFYGYRPCVCCGTEREWQKLKWSTSVPKGKKVIPVVDYRSAELTDENINRICSLFHFKCNIVANAILISTAVGFWRIYIHEDKVIDVFHGNYKGKKAEGCLKRKKANEGFHKQVVSMENLYDVVRYIYYHDKNMYKNKKSRIDRLFEQIEQERIVKELINETGE